MMHFHVTVKLVNMPFNNDHTLIFFNVSAERIHCIKVVESTSK